jgi:hypothetical protein
MQLNVIWLVLLEGGRLALVVDERDSVMHSRRIYMFDTFQADLAKATLRF